MSNEAAISQDELDKLFAPKVHVWIIKCKARHSIIGYRCFSYAQALSLFQKASKDYPNYRMEIVQVK